MIDDRAITEMHDFIANDLPKAPIPTDLEGDGVFTWTSPRYHASTYLLARSLTKVGCSIPLYVCHKNAEPLPEKLRTLPNVKNAVLETVTQDFGPFRWWHRSMSALCSGLARIFWIDSDAYFVEDPTPCFDDATTFGAVAWKDQIYGDKFFPRAFGMAPETHYTTYTPQCGTLILDMRRSYHLMELVHWIHLRLNYFEQFGSLDQTAFRVAAYLLNQPFHRYTQERVQVLHGSIFLHQDRDGVRPLVVHRSVAKFLSHPRWDPPATPDVPGEEWARGVIEGYHA